MARSTKITALYKHFNRLVVEYDMEQRTLEQGTGKVSSPAD